MHDEFRTPERSEATPTSPIALWLMAAVVVAGSAVLGLFDGRGRSIDFAIAALAHR